jgi:hypothetical protein
MVRIGDICVTGPDGRVIIVQTEATRSIIHSEYAHLIIGGAQQRAIDELSKLQHAT